MTTTKERCFLFYERWYNQLSRLPDKERLEVYEAIFRYAFQHEQSSLVYYLESIMDNIRTTIDENNERQQRFLELQKEKGRKSAQARAAYKERTQQAEDGPRLTAVGFG